MNHDGTVCQKDLGDDTAKLAESMRVYSPESTWKKAQGQRAPAFREGEPMPESASEPAAPRKPLAWLETAAALLMALSSLATAWCSFEASRWSGQSGKSAGQAESLERKANVMRLDGLQHKAAHVQVFTQYVAAHFSGNAALERFYVDRFPPDVRKAYDAWMAEKPFENPAAAPHPFVPPYYETRYAREMEAAMAESAQAKERAGVASGTSGSYLTTTVVLATVLFFVGITMRLTSQRLRLGSFIFGASLFAIVVVRMLLLPVQF